MLLKNPRIRAGRHECRLRVQASNPGQGNPGQYIFKDGNPGRYIFKDEAERIVAITREAVDAVAGELG